MKIAEYLKSTPDRMWDYAAQMGVTHAVGRMPDGRMEEVASSLDRLAAMQKTYLNRGFTLDVIEPAPLNQALKRGTDGRDRELETMRALVRNMGRLGISTLCYNWTVHFNWVRNVFDFRERGGALACGYRHADWPQDELTEIGVLTREELWKNYEYFLKAVVPVAEESGVDLAIHPSDPPIDTIRGVGRIFTSVADFEKAMALYPSPRNGITLCQGTVRLMDDCQDLPATIRRLAPYVRYVHFRDVAGDKLDFHETFHDNGPTDMAECVRAYDEVGFDGFARVDHVPTLAGEPTDTPGYALLGRLFAVGYFKGLLEMNSKSKERKK